MKTKNKTAKKFAPINREDIEPAITAIIGNIDCELGLKSKRIDLAFVDTNLLPGWLWLFEYTSEEGDHFGPILDLLQWYPPGKGYPLSFSTFRIRIDPDSPELERPPETQYLRIDAAQDITLEAIFAQMKKYDKHRELKVEAMELKKSIAEFDRKMALLPPSPELTDYCDAVRFNAIMDGWRRFESFLKESQC